MIHEIVIPVLDQTTNEARLLGWLKHEGDRVKRGEVLCEIETEKATVEIESPAEGVLRRILIDPGTVIRPLTVVALVGGADDSLPEIDPFYRLKPEAAAPAPAPASAPAVAPAQAGAAPRKVVASPRAKRLAEEHNLDLSSIAGTGPGGRIQEEDVQRALAASPAAQSGASRAAQATAQRVTQSWTTIPHFYTTVTIDMSEVIARQEALGRAYTYTDVIAQGIATALRGQPSLNGWYKEGRAEISPEIHLGLIVHTPRGLVIPTLANLQDRDLASIAAERARIVEQARAGKVSAGAMTGATFSLSNLGPGHVDHFTAIISPPQVAILSVGSILLRPHVAEGELVVRPTAGFTLGVDHRAVDGRAAAGFLEALKSALEQEG